MGKTKKDTNVRVAGQRKQTKESKAEQMCMDNIPMNLNGSNDSPEQKSHCKHRCTHCQVPKLLQNLSLLLTRSFCPLDTIVIASSARPTFASSLRDVFSFVLCSFALSNWSTESYWKNHHHHTGKSTLFQIFQ